MNIDRKTVDYIRETATDLAKKWETSEEKYIARERKWLARNEGRLSAPLPREYIDLRSAWVSLHQIIQAEPFDAVAVKLLVEQMIKGFPTVIGPSCDLPLMVNYPGFVSFLYRAKSRVEAFQQALTGDVNDDIVVDRSEVTSPLDGAKMFGLDDYRPKN